jgi:hypothetical protein
LLLFTKCYKVDKLEEDEMVESSGVHGGKELLIQGFGWKMRGVEGAHLEDMDIYGRILL